MAKQDDREYMYVHNNDVVPRYLYDKTSCKYCPRKDRKQIETLSNPPYHHIDIWNIKNINNVMKDSHNVTRSGWQKDFIQEKSTNAILVRGAKILEKKGIDPPSDQCMHTVTSVLYKSCQDMLIFCSQMPTDGSIEELKEYLNSVLREEKESLVPQIRNNFKKAYIYQPYTQTRRMVDNFKHGCEEFCRTLKNSVPEEVVIESPKPDSPDAERDTVNIYTASTVTVAPDGDIKNNLDSKSSISSSGKHIEVAETHLPKKCTEEELNLNSNFQSCEANDVHCTSILTGMACESGQLQESGLEKYSMGRRDIGGKDSSEKFCRRTGDPKNCHVGQTKANLLVHQTSKSQAETFSCTKGHVANASHCFETSDNEKPKELNKTKCEAGEDNIKKAIHSGQSNPDYSTVVTQQDHLGTGSGNINANQSKLFQGLDNRDEMVDLKSNKNVSHTKQNQKSDEDKNMKTKLLTPVNVTKDACGLERKYFGIVNETVPEKVLILLGASGSGKTTLLNFIANYFHGNKNADDELVHVECTSQTSAITAYTFCSSVEDIPITIIDTPGLNDSSGGEIRDHVQSLKTFLANAASKNVDVHALGFVAQAHLVRLSSSERLVMDYVSTMFGQNVSDHLITLVTFADTQDTPPVIEAMKNYKVNFKQFLKFNNSALSNGKTDEVDDLEKVYYRVCWRNWKKCLKTLKDSPPLSVNVMKAVQSEIYNTIVTESAEKDLKAEITAFFKSYKREKFLSKENLKFCEHIWSLAAVVQRLKGAQMSSRTIEDILLEYAKVTCKELRISPESIVHTLALAPSKALTVVGTEIIQSMSCAYSIMKESESKCSSKYLIDISHCHGCSMKTEHRMKRTEINQETQFTVGSETIYFKFEDCICIGDVHGEQPTRPAHRANEMLHLTVNRLRKALQSYSFSGYTVSEEIFLNHLGEHLASEYKNFVDFLVRMMCR